LLNISNSLVGGDMRLAVFPDTTIPESLVDQNNVALEIIDSTTLGAERALSNMTKKKCDLFISPYPKLPMFGGNCKYVNIIHDILYITHVSKKGIKRYLDILRLKAALKKADLTWYDSRNSLNETRRLLGYAGRSPKVRYPGIDQRFASPIIDTSTIAKDYGLKPGYILAVGNVPVALLNGYIGVGIDTTAAFWPYDMDVHGRVGSHSGYAYGTATAQEVLYVPSAGTYTFYMRGHYLHVSSYDNCGYSGHNLTLTYYPTAYGAVVTTVPPSRASEFDNSEPVEVQRTGPDGQISTTIRHKVDLRDLELRATRARAEAERLEKELLKAQQIDR
jgi:hypothetical protein